MEWERSVKTLALLIAAAIFAGAFYLSAQPPKNECDPRTAAWLTKQVTTTRDLLNEIDDTMRENACGAITPALLRKVLRDIATVRTGSSSDQPRAAQ
jgi:hypothetical protein